MEKDAVQYDVLNCPVTQGRLVHSQQKLMSAVCTSPTLHIGAPHIGRYCSASSAADHNHAQSFKRTYQCDVVAPL